MTAHTAPQELAHRILVIDPYADMREALRELLVDTGFEAVAADSMDRGAELLEGRDFSLVIAAFTTVGRDPKEAWDEVSRLQAAAAPACVGLITSGKLPAHLARERDLAFVLQIPVDLDTLLGTIGAHVRSRAVDREHEELIRAYFDALSDKDWDRLAALCSESVIYNVPGSDAAFSRTVVGREAFREFAAKTFESFPNARFRVEAIVPLPSAAVARYRSHWRADDGRPIELAGSVAFRFVGGRIATIGVRTDLRQLWAVLASA